MAKIILDVPDISCEHCQRAIEGALNHEPGVTSAKVDVPSKKVYLDYNPGQISLDQVKAVLDDEGYAVAGQTPQ